MPVVLYDTCVMFLSLAIPYLIIIGVFRGMAKSSMICFSYWLMTALVAYSPFMFLDIEMYSYPVMLVALIISIPISSMLFCKFEDVLTYEYKSILWIMYFILFISILTVIFSFVSNNFIGIDLPEWLVGITSHLGLWVVMGLVNRDFR